MMAYKIRNLSASRLPKSQRGIASIVFVVLVSLAVTASSLGVMHSIKSSQEIYVASNAVTHTENGTWLGAEAFRLYLLELGTSSAVGSLAGDSFSIALSDTSIGSISVSEIVVENDSDPDTPDVVSATIANEHNASKSSSSIRVVYHFTPPPPPPPVAAGDITMSFDGNLNLIGGLDLHDGDSPIPLSVGGDLVVRQAGINPLGKIRSAGKVELGSSVQAESIHSNDDVSLEGSARVNLVETLGSLTTVGAAGVVRAEANGFINIGGNFNSEQLWTLDNATINSASHQFVNAKGTIATRNSIETIEAVGNVNLLNWFSVGSVVSEGDINCVSKWWGDFDSLSANGKADDSTNCKVGASTTSGATNTVTPMEPVEPYVHQPLDLDVWTFRDSANYFFEYDSGLDKIKVTVAGINGVTDDEYYIGDYGNPNADHRSYLCKAFNAAGKCSLPTTPLVPVCVGQSLYNECIEYDEGTNTFTFIAVNSAPGVMFFDGNLHLENGHGMSTFIVSGNITTGGSFKTWAPNYGGYEKICEGDPDHLNKSADIESRYQTEFADHYPRSFCNISGATYIPQKLGNIALAAGGRHPSNPTSYVGGDITLGASSVVVGSVFAGNHLITEGDVDIRGLLSGSGDGDQTNSDTGNVFSGSTSINLQVEGDFDPTDLPIVDGEYHIPLPDGAQARLHWIRYL